MFQVKASQQPQVLAVSGWDCQMTYGELEKLSNLLAFHLLSMGVGPGVAVPILFERSAWVVVAILGVLKTGGYFMNLDPERARDRKEIVLGGMNAPVILTSHRYRGIDLQGNHIAVPCGPQEAYLATSLLTKTSTSLLPPPEPESPIYAYFTSDSAEAPKAVILNHKAVCSSSYYLGIEAGITSGLRVLQFAHFTSDTSMFEILTTLVHGGTIVMPETAALQDDLKCTIQQASIDMAILTPSVARLIEPFDCPRLQIIMLGGETLRREDFERWADLHAVFSVYGPAKAAILSTVDQVNLSMDNFRRIGFPIGCRFWVVDEKNDQVLLPLGSTGELLIEGPILANKYISNEPQTEDSFIENPSWLLQGATGIPGRSGRLYKTGDLGVLHEDGSVAYVGEKCNQVKIHGRRVDLDKIERNLKKCLPLASDVVVEVIQLAGDSKTPRLAAFFTFTEKKNSPVKESGYATLRVFSLPVDVEEEMSKQLPAYMIPSICWEMNCMPVESSGETDRKALRNMAANTASSDMVASNMTRVPTTEAECILQDVWANALNMKPSSIGLDNSFFQLGGDSITAMTVSSSARAQGLWITVAQILREKTISRILASQENTHKLSSVIPTTPEFVAGESFPLGPIQRLYFSAQIDPRIAFDQAFLLKLKKRVSHGELCEALETLTLRHPILNARFGETAPGVWEQRFPDDLNGPSNVQYEKLSEESQLPFLIASARETLDIENGPLLSSMLIEDEDGTFQRLFISIHHLVVDLVSWRVLLQQLEDLLINGRSQFKATLGFPGWSTMQAAYALEHLDSDPELPFNPSPPMLSYWGLDSQAFTSGSPISVDFALSKAVTSAILGPANKAFQTKPVDLMISALLYSFNKAFPDRELPAVYNESHGRQVWDDSIDISQTIGWFTTFYPIQILLDSDKVDIPNFVRRTKDAILSVSRNGWDYFTSRLSTLEKVETFASQLPIEIMFNYAGIYQQMEREDALFENIPLPEGSNPPSMVRYQRSSLFDVLLQVSNGQLSVVLVFDKALSHQDGIKSWMRHYQEALTIIASEFSKRETEWTLADFPGVFESYSEMYQFIHTTLPNLDIAPQQVEDVFPCAPIQKGILVSQIKDPKSYQTVFEVELSTTNGVPLVLDRIRDAWCAVVKKHALLRAFIIAGCSAIHSHIHVILKDLAPDVEIQEWESQQLRLPEFEHKSMSMVKRQHRLLIARQSPTAARLVFDMNHAITDAHSRNILMNDLQTAFEGNFDFRCPSYKDFISYIGRTSHEQGLAHWRTYLHNVEPCYFPRLSESFEDTGEIATEVPDIDTPKLRRFCRENEVTPATILQLAWAVVLSQYTGSPCPSFGILSSGRDVPIARVNDIFGPFIGILPCKISQAPDTSIQALLELLQKDYLQGLSHQAVSLAEIHNLLGLGSSSLFNTVVTLQKVVTGTGPETKTLKVEVLSGEDPTEVCPWSSTFHF